MRRTSPLLRIASAVLVLTGSVFAQNAISAKAGMINVADGDVYLLDAKGGEPRKVEPKITELIDVKEGQTLKTTEGRVEVLLAPGAFLRMGDESSFKMISARLVDSRIDMLSGSALIEVAESLDDSRITILAKDGTVTIAKAGLYRIDADPARVRVYMGEATIARSDGEAMILKSGKGLVAGGNGWTAERFDAKESDPLMRWAKRRSGYLALANVSAARQATPSSTRVGAWQYNPYFGFATYMPWSGTLRSPFGYYYYTPYTVVNQYYPPAQSSGSAWMGTGSRTDMGGGRGASMGGYIPGSSSSASSSVGSAPAPSAGTASMGATSSGGGGGRGGSSGGTTGGGTSSGGGGGGRGN